MLLDLKYMFILFFFWLVFFISFIYLHIFIITILVFIILYNFVFHTNSITNYKIIYANCIGIIQYGILIITSPNKRIRVIHKLIAVCLANSQYNGYIWNINNICYFVFRNDRESSQFTIDNNILSECKCCVFLCNITDQESISWFVIYM